MPTLANEAVAESITAAEIGLPADARVPFRFVPARQWSPLVISFPHVGLAWPHDLRPKPQVVFPANADYEVHRLYAGCDRMGAAALCAVYSRLVVDLNRAPDDITSAIVPDHPAPRPRRRPGGPPLASPGVAPLGRGVIWDRAVGNIRVLPRPLRYAEFTERIHRYHAPYYRALGVLLERRRTRFGYAVLLDAHSMPGSVGVDLVLGTLDGQSCAAKLAELALSALAPSTGNGAHLNVQRDTPYRGGELIRTFGRPDEGFHAIQLEISRARYMNERSHRLYTIPSTPSAQDPGESRPGHPRGLAEVTRRVKSLVRILAHPGLFHASGDNAACKPGS